MTPEEHLLMVMMFARQAEYISTIEDMLVSRGVISRDDLPAFEGISLLDPGKRLLALQNTLRQYRALANDAEVRLPDTFPAM